MTGIYLRCDKCGATLGGEEVDRSSSRGLSYGEAHKLQEEARRRGWTGPLTWDSNQDRCPKCSGPQEGQAL